MAPTRKRTWTQRRDGDQNEPCDTNKYHEILESKAKEMEHRENITSEIDALEERLYKLKKMRRAGKLGKAGKKEYQDISKDKKNLAAQKCRAKNNIENYDNKLRLMAAEMKTKAAEEETRAAKEETRAAKEETRAAKEELRAVKDRIAVVEDQVFDLTYNNIVLSYKLLESQQHAPEVTAPLVASPSIPCDHLRQSGEDHAQNCDSFYLDNSPLDDHDYSCKNRDNHAVLSPAETESGDHTESNGTPTYGVLNVDPVFSYESSLTFLHQ